MKTLRLKALLVSVALVLAACTNAIDSGAGGSGGAIEPGSVSDPASPAYFQETIGDRVLFAVDQSTISEVGKVTLQAQADWLLRNTDFTATIEGHADEQGTREYNVALGARRANAAREYLVSRGVAGNRLQVVSYGKERPIALCSEESCYAKNRRAVTVLTGLLTG